MRITYRPARLEDLKAALGIVQETYNDLRLRHGLPATVVLGPPAFQRACLAEDPDGLWVAERGGSLLGFGFSWMRERFWYLAQLFVLPGNQASGIGRALLSKTMQLAERRGADNRALITMAYNTASTGLYIRNGLYPREPLLRLAAAAHSIKPVSIAGLRYNVAPIEPWPGGRDWLGRIDQEVLGFRREEHHAFLLAGSAGRAVRLEEAGDPVGYAYVSAEGHIGPLAVAPCADPRQVFCAAIHCALEGNPKQVSMIVPGRADVILDAARRLGFRIEEPLVLLSANPFGDWRHYLPSNPGFM
jgi:ribosomal protein S18 acetylase RimI-like enzyme